MEFPVTGQTLSDVNTTNGWKPDQTIPSSHFRTTPSIQYTTLYPSTQRPNQGNHSHSYNHDPDCKDRVIEEVRYRLYPQVVVRSTDHPRYVQSNGFSSGSMIVQWMKHSILRSMTPSFSLFRLHQGQEYLKDDIIYSVGFYIYSLSRSGENLCPMSLFFCVQVYF